MKYILTFLLAAMTATAPIAAGETVDYQVAGAAYEGHYVSPSPDAPLILLVHDWDGLTEYEVKRAGMLAEMGYAVFAADLFGAGIRPTEVKDKRQHTGELYKDREKMRSLLKGALETAESKGANVDNVVMMGYCFGGAAVLETVVDRLHDRRAHLGVLVQIDLVAGIGADHMRDVAVAGFGLAEGQAPLHQASVRADPRPVDLRQSGGHLANEGIISPAERGGGIEIVVEYLQHHELVE